MNDITMHVGQTKIATCMAKRQFRMVHSEKVQDRGMEIVDVDHLCCDGTAQVVRFSVGDSGLDPSAGQPGKEKEKKRTCSVFRDRTAAARYEKAGRGASWPRMEKKRTCSVFRDRTAAARCEKAGRGASWPRMRDGFQLEKRQLGARSGLDSDWRARHGRR